MSRVWLCGPDSGQAQSITDVAVAVVVAVVAAAAAAGDVALRAFVVCV